MGKPPVPTPPSTPPGNPPSGATGPTAPCCPDVARFEQAARHGSYFGFDDRSNVPANVGVDEYWIPPTKAKAVPSDRETRDGARWVSVGLNRETLVEIHFDGNYQPSCIANCSFEFDPPDLGEVTGPAITQSGVGFRIKGKSVGEGSLKVMCDGAVRGYFHVWCARPVTLSVDVSCLITPDTQAVSYSVGALQTYMNNVFRQAVIEFDLRDLGNVEIDTMGSGYVDPRTENLGFYRSMDALAMSADWKFAADYRLYFYTPPGTSRVGEGIATAVGGHGAGFVGLMMNINDGYHTLTHEMGHLLGLNHPVYDAITERAEFPEWQFANTWVSQNILMDDPENIMGYIGYDRGTSGETATLGYRQWKKCRRR